MLLAVLAVGCSSSAEPATTTGGSVIFCEDPPASEVDASSELEMTVEPGRTTPRQRVMLAVSSAGLPEDALAGVDAAWQCWDGRRWVTTHIVYRGFGDNSGLTIPVNQQFQIRVPSIGLDLDEGYPIVVPQVEPGLYRIEDEIVAGESSVPGFVIVEVVER